MKDPYSSHRKQNPYTLPLFADWFTGVLYIDGSVKDRNPNANILTKLTIDRGLVCEMTEVTFEHRKKEFYLQLKKIRSNENWFSRLWDKIIR